MSDDEDYLRRIVFGTDEPPYSGAMNNLVMWREAVAAIAEARRDGFLAGRGAAAKVAAEMRSKMPPFFREAEGSHHYDIGFGDAGDCIAAAIRAIEPPKGGDAT